MGLDYAIRMLEGLFKIEELVPPYLISKYTEAQLWALFDPELLHSLALIRNVYGQEIYINGRGRVDSGFRDCSSGVGANLSAHRTGQALDLHAVDLDGLQELVMRDGELFGLTEMEDPAYTKSWCHISTRPHIEGKFRVFIP